MQLDCGAVNVNDVISNLMCTTAPMGGWKTSGMGARFGGAEGLRKYCRQEAVVAPRTNVGAGGNYYNNSHKALTRMNKLMTKLALHHAAPGRQVTPAVYPLVTWTYGARRYLLPVVMLTEPRATQSATMTTTTRCCFVQPERRPTSTPGARTTRTTSG